MPSVKIERHDAVAEVTLNRPEKLNAIDGEILRELRSAVEDLEGRPDVRAVVLTGAGGKAFAAGADVASMANMGAPEAKRFADLGHRLAETMARARFPVIAAVGGFALGGGCELALACDVIVASDKARLGQPEVGLGVVPGFGGTQRLARRVGVGRALELCMSGRIVGAEEALRIGLVDAVVAHDDLLARTREMASAMAAKAPLAVAAVKRAILFGQDVPLAVACELEATVFSSLFGTRDQREGMHAFLEKRPPSFEGR